MQQISQRTLRLFLSGALLALLVLLTFNVGTTHAVPTPNCSTPVVVTTNTSGSCAIGANMAAGAGDLTVSADPNFVVSNYTGTPPTGSTNGTISGAGTVGDPYTYSLNGTSQTFGIAFNSTVTDGRGGTAGWSLAANTTGFLAANSTIQLTGVSPSCTSTCFPLALTTDIPLSLGVNPQTFVSAPPSGTSTNGGIYTIATVGALTLPGNLAAGTAVTGSVILTLFNGPLFD